jgi:hypothetical protein
MAVDYTIHLECQPKNELGNGDALRGTGAILELLKARKLVAHMAQRAAEQGISPAGMEVVHRFLGPDGRTVDTPLTYESLVTKAAPLVAHESACAKCPANLFETPFGCVGMVPYPVSLAAEEWLMSRVQPTSIVGGFLCQQMINDFGYDGEPIRGLRERGLMEARTAVHKVVHKRWLSSTKVSSDQILHGLFAQEGPMSPGTCMSVLLWFGCLKVDGRHLGGVEDAALMVEVSEMSVEQRWARVALDVGPPAEQMSTASLQGLLHALYRSWMLNVPILVEY